MESYRLAWTQEGRDEPEGSVVTYALTAAETDKVRKTAEAGVGDVQIAPVKPGQWPVTARCPLVRSGAVCGPSLAAVLARSQSPLR